MRAQAARIVVVLEVVCGRDIPDSDPCRARGQRPGPFSFLVPSVVPSDQIFALDGDNDFRYHDFRLVAPLSRFWGGHSPGWSRLNRQLFVCKQNYRKISKSLSLRAAEATRFAWWCRP
eukprot:scaffold98314_cov77-Phaeocystis_antarctica.AAC.1